MRAAVLGFTFAIGLAAGCAVGSDSHGRGGDGGLDAGRALDATSPSIDATSPPLDATTSTDATLSPRDVGPDAPDAATCPAGRTRCGTACVELASDVAHCGACDRACDVPFGSETCVGGTCFVGTCDPGRADCNTTASDGCEGTCEAGAACATSCGTTGARSCASICAPTCTPPAESCNARDDDCDGACESGLSGCRRPVHRALRNAGGHFYTNDRAEAMSAAFTVESFDYYFLYAASVPGAVELHRCRLSDGHYFYTTSSACEGASGATNEGVLGWMASSALCGSTPLFRLYSGSAGHFYTIDAGERASAIASGYVDEGISGHVWRVP
jgi:hypothetical protein